MKNLIKAQLYVLFLMLFSNGVFANALVVEKISVSPAGNIVRNPDADATRKIAFQFSQSGVTISNPAFGANFNAGGSCNISLYNGTGFIAQYVAMRFSENATRLAEIEFYEKTSSGTTKIPANQITVGGANGRVITSASENNSPDKAILADGITNHDLSGSQYAAYNDTTVWFDLGSPRVLDRLVIYPGFYNSTRYNPTFYLGDSSDIGPANHRASVVYSSVATNTGRAPGGSGFLSTSTPNVPFAIKSIGHCDYPVPSGISARTNVSSFRPSYYNNTTYIKGPGNDPFTRILNAGDSTIAATPNVAVSGYEVLPVITITKNPDTTSAPSKVVAATDNVSSATTMAYVLTDSWVGCNSSAFLSGLTRHSYTEGADLVLIGESNNGKKVCFRAGKSYFAYKASSVIGGISTKAPVVAEVTAVPELSNNVTPSYTFSSDHAGTITYGGDCSSLTTEAVSGDNTVVFNTLTAGTYTNCTITVTEKIDNKVSNTLTLTTFVVDTTPPALTITKPGSDGYISDASIGDGLLIEGTSDAGQTVNITLGSAQTIEVQAEATTGAWQTTLPASYFTDLAAGSVTLRVQVTNAIGNTAKVELALTKQAASSQTIASTTDETYASQRYSVSASLVTDKATELMWQQCSLGQTLVNNTCQGVAHHYTWADALKAAQDNTDGGHSDWRLPNRNELFSLVAKDRYNPSINLEMYPNTVEIAYWTSSPASQENTKSWVVDFNSGQARTAARTYTYPVRLVRGN